VQTLRRTDSPVVANDLVHLNRPLLERLSLCLGEGVADALFAGSIKRGPDRLALWRSEFRV
jgi:hypothetical protein